MSLLLTAASVPSDDDTKTTNSRHKRASRENVQALSGALSGQGLPPAHQHQQHQQHQQQQPARPSMAENAGADLADFRPPTHPISGASCNPRALETPPAGTNVGVTRPPSSAGATVQPAPGNTNDAALTVEGFQNLPSAYAHDYYKRLVPMYTDAAAGVASGAGSGGSNELLRKLNQIIHMLEEQQDVRSGSVNEELILYCFLGVFTIFVVDSFARAGKYIR